MTPTFAATAGKKLVETPDWTVSGRVNYEIGAFQFGVQAKYVGSRFLTDVNDDSVGSYTIVDANVRYSLASLGVENCYVQFNANNLFDKKYYTIGSGTRTALTGPGAGVPALGVGGRQAFQGTIHMEF